LNPLTLRIAPTALKPICPDNAVARDVSMRDIYVGILPFWAATMACLVIPVTFLQLSLILPNTMLD